MSDDDPIDQAEAELTDITVIATGLDPAAPDFETRLTTAGLPDATIAFQRGVVMILIAVEPATLLREVEAAALAVTRIGGTVVRIEPDPLVTQSDIAERAGLTRAAISQYLAGRRGDGAFPPPIARVTADSPLYDWCRVVDWLCRHGVLGERDRHLAAALAEANRLSVGATLAGWHPGIGDAAA